MKHKQRGRFDVMETMTFFLSRLIDAYKSWLKFSDRQGKCCRNIVSNRKTVARAIYGLQ